jgi:lincosamide nucleotidyltransferase A/C/D/E
MIESPGSRMTAADVAGLYEQLQAAGVRIWIDGGWAVDALLGRETRPHDDLDIAIQQKDVAQLRAILETDGYVDISRDDTRPWTFVLGDGGGRRVDVHVIVVDAVGNGILGPPENGHMYPAGALDGSGVVEGKTVRCLTPEFAVKFRAGYIPRASDRHDVAALCLHFGIPVPDSYR